MRNTKNLVITIIVAVIIVVVGLFYWLSLKNKEVEKQVEIPFSQPPVLEYGLPVDSFCIEELIIQPDSYLSDVLYKSGATQNDVACVGNLSRAEFDVRTIRAGNRCKAFYSEKDSVRVLDYFIYEKNPVDYCVFCFADSFRVYHGKKPTEIRRKRSHAEITSSLWNATVESNMSPMLALNLSDIFAWTIDFFGLQKGDRFTVVYDEVYIDTTFVEIGRIHAAEFISGKKVSQAFYFVQDSIGSYWDTSGNSLKRAFLKAPLKFSRISSHFSYARKHPILRIVRPHTGVDYAAPAGTPVMSIGDGTVIAKGFNGEGGHTVKIRHNSVYTTAYLHLSKYGEGVNVGSRVSQGQVIGYVGSTGTSTGPHLDFRVWMNGKPINPLTVESPPVEPIRESNKAVFDSICVNYKKELGI
ncbi:MAG: peptidoglycan DD-metalloendopeptidase family protein [Dysgonamonadaceae bacterium]|jgi:murein DD-endopeptidase MepM/ murein hydrolase activator NlpD|nr:peptidoglycan DD-metalloendopeptidase family protein [Dysgonamonadaceae bacterium]